ncbi:MAG: hypothetical protein KBT40_00245, partial [bacterium]|nr:hypothetical protein [Candidatus Minthenecus merdequi]
KLAWTMPRLGQVCKANQQDVKITANRKQRACSFAKVQRNLSKRNFKNTKKFICYLSLYFFLNGEFLELTYSLLGTISL